MAPFRNLRGDVCCAGRAKRATGLPEKRKALCAGTRRKALLRDEKTARAPQNRVFYTVNVGRYDRLRSAPRFPGWRYVYFADRALPLWARAMADLGWEVRRIPPLGPDRPQVLASREPRLLPHRFLAEFDYSLYADANIVFSEDPTPLLEQIGWPDFTIAHHPTRRTVDEEVEACVAFGKGPEAILRAQLEDYRARGLPDDAQLYETGVLGRRHNAPDVARLGEAWWRAFSAHPWRDQISFPWAVHESGVTPTPMPQREKQAIISVKSRKRPWLVRQSRSLAKKWRRIRALRE